MTDKDDVSGNGRGAKRQTRPKRTRLPPADGPPANLRKTRGEQKATTLASAETILGKLRELELPLTEEGWNEAKALADPGGASWRATYRIHVAHLFREERGGAGSPSPSAKEHAALKKRLAQTNQCVRERDAVILDLRSRIADLEAEIERLSRGTRTRRKRRRQARHAPTAAGGSA